MNIKYISLGASCATIYQINKYIKNSQTLFFDWLITNQFIDIIELLNNQFSIDDIINIESITILEKIGNKQKVKFNKLKDTFSVHDLPQNYTSLDVIQFINKIKKKYIRFINELLISNQFIYFLRLGKNIVSYQDQQNLCNIIKKINPKIQFKLIFITHGINYTNSITHNKSIINITLYNDNTKLESKEWTLDNLDWQFVFKNIKGAYLWT
jgi:hypothetical protein